jgi:F5/8 type C domain
VRLGVEWLDRDVLTQLVNRGLEYVVINRGNRQERAFRRYVAGVKGVELVCSTDAHIVYRFPQTQLSQVVANSGRVDTSLPITSVSANVSNYVVGLMMDGDLATRWDTGPQSADMMLEIDLGKSRTVSAVEMSLGQFSSDFPRGLRIEASDDRNTWREVWRGTSAGLALTGALRDPATLPVLYDLGSVRARYLRFSLTEKDDTYYWSIAELKVLGPVS